MARSGQGRAGFARRSGPLTGRTVLRHLGGGKGGWPGFLFSPREETGFPPVLQAITLTADVDGRRMVEQAVENRGGDDRISEDRAPVAVAFVGSQDDTATLGREI